MWLEGKALHHLFRTHSELNLQVQNPDKQGGPVHQSESEAANRPGIGTLWLSAELWMVAGTMTKKGLDCQCSHICSTNTPSP